MKILHIFLAVIFLVIVGLFVYKSGRDKQIHVVSINAQSESEKKEAIFKNKVNSLIKDYISSHPDEISDAINKLHVVKRKSEEDKISEYFIKESENESLILGNINGSINIIVFYDYACSFCKNANKIIRELTESNQDIKLILKPLSVLGKNSVYAAKFILAISKISPDNIYEIHNKMMNLIQINEESVRQLISEYDDIKYDMVKNEINAYWARDAVAKNLAIAKKFGMKGVPSYVINNRLIHGEISLERIKDLISR